MSNRLYGATDLFVLFYCINDMFNIIYLHVLYLMRVVMKDKCKL